MTPEEIFQYIDPEFSYLGLGILSTCAMIEYIFPPFPGDTVLLFAAFLIGVKGWSPISVILGITCGGLIGASGHYYLGRVIYPKRRSLPSRKLGFRVREKIEFVLEKLRRHGMIYIVINRFVPGVRGVFFIATGMARLPIYKVLGYGAISALLWNIMILSIGYGVGYSWSKLEGFVSSYLKIGGGILGVVIVISFVYFSLRSFRRKQ
jgi:membrane protein DedA with SNARE-associated domain